MNEGYKNISTNNFVAHTNEAQTFTARVNHKTSGVLSLSIFAVVQIIMGVKCSAFDTASENEANRINKLLADLSMHLLQITTEDVPITLSREDVILCKKLLEFRIWHCEMERDNNVESFNPDTYISQKLLLLDIREWLMVEVIEEMPSVASNNRYAMEA